MIRSLWNSRCGMSSQMEKLETISNNLSNINTPGYKRVDVGFENLLQEKLKRQGYPVSDDKSFTGTGVKTTQMQMDTSQGGLINTNCNTDLALDGKGYFKVIDANGNEAYTRSGSFEIDGNGKVVDPNGNRLVISGENDRTKFYKDGFKVDEDGNILGKGYENLKIPVYNVVDENSMKSIGKNLFVPGNVVDENGNESKVEVFESNKANVLQGFIENSNVNIEQEFTDMIMTQRAFQLNSSALKTADEMWQMANNLKGR